MDFFFKREDGIRDAHELLELRRVLFRSRWPRSIRRHWPATTLFESSRLYSPAIARLTPLTMVETGLPSFSNCSAQRSEERRVGKECVSTCRSRWSPYHYQQMILNLRHHYLFILFSYT